MLVRKSLMVFAVLIPVCVHLFGMERAGSGSGTGSGSRPELGDWKTEVSELTEALRTAKINELKEALKNEYDQLIAKVEKSANAAVAPGASFDDIHKIFDETLPEFTRAKIDSKKNALDAKINEILEWPMPSSVRKAGTPAYLRARMELAKKKLIALVVQLFEPIYLEISAAHVLLAGESRDSQLHSVIRTCVFEFYGKFVRTTLLPRTVDLLKLAFDDAVAATGVSFDPREIFVDLDVIAHSQQNEARARLDVLKNCTELLDDLFAQPDDGGRPQGIFYVLYGYEPTFKKAPDDGGIDVKANVWDQVGIDAACYQLLDFRKKTMELLPWGLRLSFDSWAEILNRVRFLLHVEFGPKAGLRDAFERFMHLVDAFNTDQNAPDNNGANTIEPGDIGTDPLDLPIRFGMEAYNVQAAILAKAQAVYKSAKQGAVDERDIRRFLELIKAVSGKLEPDGVDFKDTSFITFKNMPEYGFLEQIAQSKDVKNFLNSEREQSKAFFFLKEREAAQAIQALLYQLDAELRALTNLVYKTTRKEE